MVPLCIGVQQLLSTLSALICHSLSRVHQPRQTGGMRFSPPAASGRDLAMQLATPCACAFAIAMGEGEGEGEGESDLDMRH